MSKHFVFTLVVCLGILLLVARLKYYSVHMDMTCYPLSCPKLRLHWRGNTPPYQALAIALLSVFLLLSTACASSIATSTARRQTQVTQEQPIIAAYQPHKTIDVWLDDTNTYPREYFTQAKNALADAIDQSVQVNSGGLVAFINIITSNSWKPDNTLLTIIVPVLGPDPLPPVLQAKPTPIGDPFTDGQAAKKVKDANAQTLTQYQEALHGHHAVLTHIRAQVRRLTDTLRGLNPAIDTSGVVDMWGMFGRASQRLNAGKSMRLLLIASSLEQNTWRQFAPYETLWSVHVRSSGNTAPTHPNVSRTIPSGTMLSFMQVLRLISRLTIRHKVPRCKQTCSAKRRQLCYHCLSFSACWCCLYSLSGHRELLRHPPVWELGRKPRRYSGVGAPTSCHPL